LKVITWVSLSFIDSLNLEDRLNYFNFKNLEYVNPEAFTPALTRAKNVYYGLVELLN